ncbi:hypothetical protein ES705_34958 [subsurface metagenome]
MRLLIDNALSPIVAEKLKQAGHDAVHVRELGMQCAPDDEIFKVAEEQERTLISADTDFGAILSLRDKCKPSFILIRKNTNTKPIQIADLLRSLLPELQEDINSGAVITITDTKLRIRMLPIK